MKVSNRPLAALLILAAVALVVGVISQTYQTATNPPRFTAQQAFNLGLVEIDPRISSFGVTIAPEENYEFRLRKLFITVNGDWEPTPTWAKEFLWNYFPEAGGDHNVYGLCMEEDGSYIRNSSFTLSWNGGTDVRTPEASGWANIPIFDGYNPASETGGYTWAVQRGNPVYGLGLPNNQHVSFFAVWVRVRDVPTPVPVPSATSTPSALHFYLIQEPRKLGIMAEW